MDGYIETERGRWPVQNWRAIGPVDTFARFATGQRTLTRHPEADDTHRWHGTIQNDGYKGRVWRGPDPETVHDEMENSLGPIDAPGQPTKYVITE